MSHRYMETKSLGHLVYHYNISINGHITQQTLVYNLFLKHFDFDFR